VHGGVNRIIWHCYDEGIEAVDLLVVLEAPSKHVLEKPVYLNADKVLVELCKPLTLLWIFCEWLHFNVIILTSN
jgi:hypothetical protein